MIEVSKFEDLFTKLPSTPSYLHKTYIQNARTQHESKYVALHEALHLQDKDSRND